MLDLPRAVGLLADKQRAMAELTANHARPPPREAAERMARRLQALAMENKRLLERAIAAQGRVIRRRGARGVRANQRRRLRSGAGPEPGGAGAVRQSLSPLTQLRVGVWGACRYTSGA